MQYISVSNFITVFH